jgi:hypothetical protein
VSPLRQLALAGDTPRQQTDQHEAQAERRRDVGPVLGAGKKALLNLISPSGGERAIWAPVALVQLAFSLVVATGTRTPKVPSFAERSLFTA